MTRNLYKTTTYVTGKSENLSWGHSKTYLIYALSEEEAVSLTPLNLKENESAEPIKCFQVILDTSLSQVLDSI